MTHPICRNSAKGLGLVAVALFLSGCNTAPIALQQANHTVGMMTSLGEQLENFRELQTAAAEARLTSLRSQKESIAELNEASTLDVQASKSAGDTTIEPFALKLLGDADGLATQKALTVEAKKAYAAKLETLLTPIPSTKKSIAQVQIKAALMGQELDSETRFTELQGFLTALADNVKALALIYSFSASGQSCRRLSECVVGEVVQHARPVGR